MLIIGAGGLAAQMIDDLEVIYQEHLFFWSETEPAYNFLETYEILKSDEEVKNYFSHHEKNFILSIGDPSYRQALLARFEKLGGHVSTFISPSAKVSKRAFLGRGIVILANVLIESWVVIEENCLINVNTIITHGCRVGSCSSIAPGVILNGDVNIGSRCFIGAGVTILPKIRIGNNVIVGAGSVVKDNFPDNVMIAGIPATIKKQLNTH